MARLLVTGANGFVGRILCEFVAERKQVISPVVRGGSEPIGGAAPCVVGCIGANTDWSSALDGVSHIVHLASRVHVMRESGRDIDALYRETNTVGTLRLAQQAAEAGVKRFVFLSSVKVNGEERDEAYSEDDRPAPTGPYATSKRDAELGLWEIAERSGMEVVVIRPPLVYGPGVKANFLSMMRWLHRGVPMPFGAISNRRSLVSIGNLVDFIVTCIDHPAAANETFLVSDGEDLSTTGLLVRLAAALEVKARLIDVPVTVLKMGAMVLGQGEMLRRLCGSLCVDARKANRLLGWSAPLSVDDGLKATADHFHATR
ncbi:MAG: SDR family oxidoreductase [Propionivibrio sp.]